MKADIVNYNHQNTEKKWQELWNQNSTFIFQPNSNPKYYVLEMFPYPSGRIHMGHLRNYTIGDALARYKKLKGFNVLHPMGFDAFGLPAENAALQHNIHPHDWTLSNVETMRSEIKSIGLAIDWNREIITCLPDYFKHEQKMFLDFVKQGLAYQKESFVNWDPVDHTVLANEQVIDGRGWRSGAIVEKKKLKQWFLKVSDFSEELLSELKNLTGWDERVLSMQEKWIGKSEGLIINFKIDQDQNFQNYQLNDNEIKIYTTRADTLFGASFLAISPHHPLAISLASKNLEIKNFIDLCNQSAVDEQTIEKQEKKGIDTNLKVLNPLDSSQKIPVYIANFVLMDYGCGAVFGCPAHDERDFEFANKYQLLIKQVIKPNQQDCNSNQQLPILEDGVLINSKFLDNLTSTEAKNKVLEILSKNNQAQKQINYRLRDWGVSRQRYWGCPIPILYLEDGSVVQVPEDQLPVELPSDVEFKGSGNPLDSHPTWKYTTYIDQSGKVHKAIRETDTFDTFFESPWYFLRYISPDSKNAFDQELVDKIMPVDHYIGGVEHAVLHLLYSRFFVKALKKCQYLNFNEPFKNLVTQGMVCHPTFKNKHQQLVYPSQAIEVEPGKFIDRESKEELVIGRSEKMSKSKKNVVEPSVIIKKYGADTARLFMLSDTPVNRDLDWLESGIDGSWRYINRIWKLVINFTKNQFYQNNFVKDFDKINNQFNQQIDLKLFNNYQLEIIKLIHKTIASVDDEYSKLGFNRAIAKIRECSNQLEKFEIKNSLDCQIMFFALTNLLILLNPIIPHLTEELWNQFGFENFIANQNFTNFNQKLIIDDQVSIAIQVLGKLRSVITVEKDLDNTSLEKIILENDNIKKYIDNKPIKKIIIVPNKLVNILI
jgi:leucyl-tRNA synthetase